MTEDDMRNAGASPGISGIHLGRSLKGIVPRISGEDLLREYRRIAEGKEGEEKGPESREGLSTSKGSDYDFHKDVMEDQIPKKLHLLATVRLTYMAEYLLAMSKSMSGEEHKYHIDQYSRKVQSKYYKWAGMILMLIEDITEMEIEFLEQNELLEPRLVCSKCSRVLLDTERHLGKCTSCHTFYSGLSDPIEGVTE